MPPIVRHFPTELPVVDVHLEQLDTVFDLADGSLLHLEFQTVHRRETLLRFLQYDVGLYAQYQRNIHTMVIYGAGISSAPETLNFGVVQYDVRNVFLGRDDGEQTYQRLRARVESGQVLEPEERLDLVFLPLMRHTRPSVEVVSGALALAQQLPEEQQRQTLAALIGLGQRFLEQHELDSTEINLLINNKGAQCVLALRILYLSSSSHITYSTFISKLQQKLQEYHINISDITLEIVLDHVIATPEEPDSRSCPKDESNLLTTMPTKIRPCII